MSLQVWLPLNGNLDNQGLSNSITINSGATIDNNGKIGKCYSLASGNYIGIDAANINNHKYSPISIAMWVYPTQNDSTERFPMCCYESGGCGISFKNSCFIFQAYIGGYKTCSSQTVVLNQWYHVCGTYDGTKLSIYVNGQLQSTTVASGTITYQATCPWEIGGNPGPTAFGSGNFIGKLNDVRIYDHCLSPKEVEELSKGLILHYKLDDKYIEPIGTTLSSDITTTAYNSVNGKYGYNNDSNLAKTSGFFQGKECVKISTIVADQQARPYVYFSNLFTSNGTNSPATKVLSFDYYTTVPTTTWLNIYKLGSGEGTAKWKTINSDCIHSGTYTNSANSIIVKPNEWNHVEVIFQGTTDADAQWGYCINGPNHTTNPDYYFLYANIQLEEGDHVTAYNSSFHSTTIYDSSGFNNNGTANNIVITEDSMRYSGSGSFNGSNSYVKANTNNWLSQGMKELTINLWAKATTWPTNGGRLFSCTETGGFNLEAGNSGYWCFPIHVYTAADLSATAYKYDSKEIQISALTADAWNMITCVYDGTGTKTYINGVLHHTYSNVSYGIHFNTNARLFLGCEANTATATSPYFNGKESDFRIYCTALSASQIKELYDTSATIDNQKNVFSRELVD